MLERLVCATYITAAIMCQSWCRWCWPMFAGPCSLFASNLLRREPRENSLSKFLN
jgi:hypothetical protein